MSNTATAFAPAKVNLCLHVTGRRADGYHLLDSLVVFPRVGDVVKAERAKRSSLSLSGPFAQDLAADGDNLVLRAAALMRTTAALHLDKNLPVTAGLGGGSADAAATLRVLANLSGAPLPSTEALVHLGADVPVCLASAAARMRGIGDQIETLNPLPDFWCVLVNSGIASPTAEVFGALAHPANDPLPPLPDRFPRAADLFDYLHSTRNDLETPARDLRPDIDRVLTALRATPGVKLARMSGSGATCFGLYEAESPALAAAAALRGARPSWWVTAAPVRSGPISEDPSNHEISQIDQ